MALIASLFALLGRFVGRVLTTTLGWASVLLFGRIPQDRQVWLAVLTFGSLAWVAAVAGVLVPDVGAVLLTALPRPDWIPEDLVRLAMLATAILLPAILGGVTLLLFDAEDRPQGTELLAQVARGYALVPILAATLVVLAVAGTIRKLDSLAHRREDAHVPIVVRPGRYDALVATLEDTLRADGLAEGRRAGSAVLTTPARLLARVAGRGIGNLVPDRLIELHGPGLKVAIYPSDLALTGEKDDVARARALVARDVPSKDAWFTTSREAQQVEDRLAALESANPATRAALLPGIDRDLLNLTIDQDTFEVLYRRRLQLAVSPDADVHDSAEPQAAAPQPAAPQPAAPQPAAPQPAPPLGRRFSFGSIVGIVVAALTAIDLALVALRDRLPHTHRR
jgi:hypothetical protein